MGRGRLGLIALTALLLALPAHAAEYYLATDGSDPAEGSRAHPWRTFERAMETLQPGDTLYVRGGEYAQRLVPTTSGREGSPITFSGYGSETARLLGDETGDAIVQVNYVDHIVVERLHVGWPQLPRTGHLHNVQVAGGKHNVVREVTIVRDGDPVAERRDGYRENGILITDGAEHTEVTQCQVQGMSLHAVSIGYPSKYTHVHHNDLTGNGMNSVTVASSRYEIQGTLIEYNELGGSLMSDGVQTDVDGSLPSEQQQDDTSSRGVIVRYNTIRDNAENGIDLKAAARWFIEGNVIHGARGNNDGGVVAGNNRYGGHGIHRGANTTARDVVIRNNVIFDNNGGTVVHEGFRIHNNVILNNRRDYTGSNSSHREGNYNFPGFLAGDGVGGFRIFNNIVGDNVFEGVADPSPDQGIDHNLYFNSRSPVAFSAQGPDGWEDLDFHGWRTLLAGAKRSEGADHNSAAIASLPFKDSSERLVGARTWGDFVPLAGSPAIDGGRPLTYTRKAGEASNRVLVEDAGFFHDGFGVTRGDLVRIGTNPPVRIVAVDYEDNQLRLEEPLSWNAGDGVGPPYGGSAPDIGAVESGAELTVAPPESPSGVRLEITRFGSV